MRIVVDSNQLSPFLSTTIRTSALDGITLAPYVFVETLLRSDARHLVSQLQSFDVLIGLPHWDVMSALATLDEKGIVSFLPYDTTLAVPTTLRQEDISKAREIKARNRAFGGTMSDCGKLFRKRLKGAKPKFPDLSDALKLSFLAGLVWASVSNKNSRIPVVSDEKSLYQAVMANRHLARYFKTILYHIISYSGAWADPNYNFEASSARDDWTDMTLPLYAADGDIILTADKKLQTAIRMVELSGAVLAKTVAEL